MTKLDGTLTDTGPLFALADPKGQPAEFARCSALLPLLPKPLVTTWPCFAEAMHLTGREGGWLMRRLLAKYITSGLLRLHTPSEGETARILQLMEKYQDRSMDLADASLVALAETVGCTQVFSGDSGLHAGFQHRQRLLRLSPCRWDGT